MKNISETNHHIYDFENTPMGLRRFNNYNSVYWTDGGLDSATVEGREKIAEGLGVNIDDIISFSSANHTNEVLIVDTSEGVYRADEITNLSTGSREKAGWSEPKLPESPNDSTGVPRGSYDGIILVGADNFKNKYLLVTGADCTPIALRGQLQSGEDFIAVIHGGRKGTMTGIMENVSKRLHWLGVLPDTVEMFVGPAAQQIEVPTEVLKDESKDDNSWRVDSISDEYMVGAAKRVLYNNQYDSARRLVEGLGLKSENVHIINADTVSEEYKDTLHSYRRDKTPKRNSLIIGF